MRRIACTPRPDWRERVEALGLVWHSAAGRPYWDESACYSFSAAEIGLIEEATAELYRLFVEAGQYVLDRDLLGSFAIPAFCHEAIREAWDAEPPALNFGRFDLGYDGAGPPKLFEFNCDTPTSLLEAAIIQWDWKEALFPGRDQFNSLHERLVAKWRDIAPPPGSSRLHLAHVADAADDAGEEVMTVAYMADMAREAGIAVQPILMADIGWDSGGRRFVDLDLMPIDAIFHLYPWEWLVNEPFGRELIESLSTTLWIEPIWKMIWSNKAILPILWELFPGHPNLLEASRQPLAGDHARKPLLAREGANVTLIRDAGTFARTGGDYGAEGFVYQRLFDLPGAGNRRPVLGSWIVDGEPAGLGIREDGPITGDTARFVPHIIGD
ncbi:glutathionylspermidine synthase [Sphingomonas oleivorans]|uniref:Glutathionylspermidine synthase n=1 Tax=Sphingomonas oleivorans TaxID=1735121 RepID=A0A2T5FZP5_9SPHN|nr:glutathionylspermidine synthase family protein [Sphingomonas oleivorans]PTQ12169.1 glutathionylspermidine synthase [Sphingomonas oleivorans]